MQQYPFPRLVSSENMLSLWLSGLSSLKWHATCFVIINLAPPIVTLRHGKTARLGERCLTCVEVHLFVYREHKYNGFIWGKQTLLRLLFECFKGTVLTHLVFATK